MVDSLPPSVRRAIAWVHDGDLVFTGCSSPLAPTLPGPIALSDFISLSGTEWNWATEYLDCKGDEERLANELVSGMAIAVADGSFKDKKGTSGFCILSSQQDLLMGANEVPSPDSSQCSYRSKLAGILGILVCVVPFARSTTCSKDPR